MFRKPPPKVTPTAGDPKAPLELFTAPATTGVASVSPFDLKLQAWLLLANIPFKKTQGSPLKGPKGKVPFVSHGGTLIGDSRFIINYLTNTFRPEGAGAVAASNEARLFWWSELDATEQARATAVTRLCEDSLYWALVWYRWWDDEGWKLTKQLILGPDPVLGSVPWPLRALLMPFIRRGVNANLRSQGVAAHAEADILVLALRDLAALSALLGDRPFFSGAKPSEGDCAVYGLLEQFAVTPWRSPLQDAVRADARIMAFLARMRALAFGTEGEKVARG